MTASSSVMKPTTDLKSIIAIVLKTYRKAPATFSLLGSYVVSKVLTTAWIDYQLYISLGEGGPLPSNVFGWLIHSCCLSPLRLSRRWVRGDLVWSYLPIAKAARALRKGMHIAADKLGTRRGDRPRTAGVAPHRQLNQSPLRDLPSTTKDLVAALVDHMHSLAQNYPSHLSSGPSRIEPNSDALFAVSHTLVTRSSAPSRSTTSAAFPSPLSRLLLSSMKGGEFFHVHTSEKGGDASMHCILHPQDAAIVVDRGWGELHGLAGCPSYSGFWFGWPAWLANVSVASRWWSWSVPLRYLDTLHPEKAQENAMPWGKKGLPPTYTMIYAPRDEQELETVKLILQAAIAFASGKGANAA